ncbi:prolyl oligopeptidase family serine peptidase [Segeticoccus rhizosphaerae]|uniref:prolyl oligopeptidase family serine peptidase n=1 Tax=Segeticoccus rhizosphaerae TaxID=1104777 RepID=UPI0010C060C1|nr:prolyl oligopeptidase family serine peptidase [Ornithinicoccus soli]
MTDHARAYPATRRDDTVEVLHGVEVPDPYRWLEDPDSGETKAWVAAQNAVTQEHLSALPARAWFQRVMEGIVGSPRVGVPDRHGTHLVVTRNDGTQEQDVWYAVRSPEDVASGGRVLIDPNQLSAHGSTSVGGVTVSLDDSLLAYALSDAGSDWMTIRVLDLATGEPVDDVVEQVKFSLATWLPDHASYLYLHFPTQGGATGTDASELPGGRLMLHRLGRPQPEDELVLEFPDQPRLFATPETSHDGRWVIVHLAEGTERNNRLWAFPVEDGPAGSRLGEPVRVVDEVCAAYEFIRTDGDELYLRTDADAPAGRVVKVDLGRARETGGAEFAPVLPESDATLLHVVAGGDELIAYSLEDAQPRLRRYGLDGTPRGEVAVGPGGLTGLSAHVGTPDVFIGVSTVTTRSQPLHLDLSTGTLTRLPLPEGGTFTPPEVVTQRRRATSKDATRVPYFLVHRADLDLDQPRPTLLYGYGGFDVPVLADFRPAWPAWLAAGGVLAIANLRGGGEYGAAWHDAGRLRHKQNVFDDFIAIAEALQAEGVTTPAQLALHGGSNGGLLVGATMTQRPELAAVALPAVGVHDMLRFHRFTIGGAWTSDFGSPDDPEMFQVIRAYSPLHNVREGTAYPATLVTTGDHDDRVVPAHSHKFTSTLQHAQRGPAPVLTRVQTSAGHGMGKPSSVVAAETADLLAFAAAHTGLTP